MEVFSDETNITKKSDIIKRVSDHLGLSLENTRKIINDKFKLVAPGDENKFYQEIENYYLGETKNYDSNYYRDLFEFTLEATGNRKIAFNNTIEELTDKITETDSVNILSTVGDLLLMTNTEDKFLLSKLFTLRDGEINFSKLNESTNFEFNNDTQLNYDGLTSVLTKNNRRWSHNNELGNTYNQILNYIETKINGMQSAEIVSYNKNEDKKLLLEYFNGVVSPLNLSYSTNKQLVSNIQSVVFDMMLGINSFMIREKTEEMLTYVDNYKVMKYKSTTSTLITLLYSSVTESNLVNKHYIEDILNGVDVGAGDFTNNNTIIDDLTNALVYNETKSIRLNNIFSMLNYIHSASGDFNLKIRPVLKEYINNLHAILTKLNHL